MRTPCIGNWAMLLVMMLSTPSLAYADIIYAYTGQFYDVVSGDYSTSMRVQGFFQTNAYLSDGTYDFANPQDWPAGFNWAFGDDLNTLTANYASQHPLSQPHDHFEVVIANGRVTEWDIVFVDFPFACHTLTGCSLAIESGPFNIDSSSYGSGPLEFSPERSVSGGSASSSGAGTWAAPFYIGVLEPGTLALARIAFGAIWAVSVIRGRRHARRGKRSVEPASQHNRGITASPHPRPRASM